MRKMTAVVALATILFSSQSLAATSSNTSAGLGIDLAGLTVASTNAPYITIRLSESDDTMGGPFTGLAKWSFKRLSFKRR